MVLGIILCLAIATASAIYLYIGTNPTLSVIANLLFHLAITALLIVFIAEFVYNAPPPNKQNPAL